MRLSLPILAFLGAALACQGAGSREEPALAGADSAASSAEPTQSRTVTLAVSGMT